MSEIVLTGTLEALNQSIIPRYTVEKTPCNYYKSISRANFKCLMVLSSENYVSITKTDKKVNKQRNCSLQGAI